MSKSKKGSQFERDLCKAFSLWWTDNERDDVFWRSHASGGRATSRRKAGKNTYGQAGDMAAMDPIGEPLLKVFTMEFKKGYPKSSIEHVLNKHPRMAEQEFEKWIAQVRQAKRNTRSISWMLVISRSQRTPMVFMPFSTWDAIGIEPKPPVFIEMQFPASHGVCRIVGFHLSEFFTMFTPKMIRRYLKQRK